MESSTGASLVGFQPSGTGAVARTMQDKARELVSSDDYDTTANFNAAKVGKLSIDSAKRLRAPYMITGESEVTGAALRDSFIAARSLTGLTDCHAFTDRTQISGVTDYGGYCSFDTIASVDGAHGQNHANCYQARLEYKGSGTLGEHVGFYARPTFSGSGTWTNRFGVVVYDVIKTGSGTLTNNFGVLVSDLVNGSNKTAVSIAQSTGFAIDAYGGAQSYHKGPVTIGPQRYVGSGLSLTVSGSATGPKAFIHSSTTKAQFGAAGGDYGIQFIANGNVRVEIQGSATNYALTPAVTNTQPLGTAALRWSDLYATNVRPGAGTAIWTSGTGTPEGNVTAPVGSLFTRTDGGAGSTLYVKESGAGNTGWVAK